MSTIEIIEPKQELEGISFKDMPTRSYGEIITTGDYYKEIILKINHEWIVSLNRKKYWTRLGNISLRVHLFPKGTKINIVV